MMIGDMLSDGLLIVEFPASPATTPSVEMDTPILLNPPNSAGPTVGALPRFKMAEERRKAYGRNASYGE